MAALHSIAVRIALSASVVVFALPARAEEEVDMGTSTVRTSQEWYGPSVFLLYGIGYSAVGVGLLGRSMQSQAARFGGTLIFSAGVGTALFGVPLMHLTHDEIGAGAASLGGQLGSLAGGGALGYAISGGERTGVFVGAAAGHVAFALADGFLLARHERVLSIETSSFKFRLVPNGLGAAVRMTH
jgi:hypothetical protein